MILRPTRTWAPASAALSSALLLALAYWNVADLVVLQDHPLPTLIFLPAMWVMLAVAVTLRIPSDRRSRRTTTRVFGATGLVMLCSGCLGSAVAFFDVGPSGRHADQIDHMSSADGRYQVKVFHWQAMLGEDGWDVVIQRRDGLRGVEAYAGCLYSEASGNYSGVQSVEAGAVRIATDEGPISIVFDPKTMHVTQRIPVDLCPGYD
ncbi:hypothetical protein AB0M36_20815 [Actinoplanes sp. NPDC051346]|uniref:hypothetical protein n=1 Tax=Actinoplanes sp. NPDC051346 TaxID=3155048 RepID=UPI0034183D58